MPSSLTVEIQGVDQLRAAFRKSPAIFTTVFDRAVKASILVLLGASRAVTPVDTGFLRGEGMKTTFEALIGKLENTAPYAVYVHDGTKFMEARPFFEWGIDAGGNQVDNIFRDALESFYKSI